MQLGQEGSITSQTVFSLRKSHRTAIILFPSSHPKSRQTDSQSRSQNPALNFWHFLGPPVTAAPLPSVRVEGKALRAHPAHTSLDAYPRVRSRRVKTPGPAVRAETEAQTDSTMATPVGGSAQNE